MKEYLPQLSDLIPLLPGAGAGAALLLFAALLKPRGKAFISVLFAGSALAAAHLVSYFRVHGRPAFPPVQGTERMVYAIAVFALGGMAAASLRSRPALKGLLHYGLAAGLVFYLLRPFLIQPPAAESHVSTLTALLLVGGLMLFWISVEYLADRLEGPSPSLDAQFDMRPWRADLSDIRRRAPCPACRNSGPGVGRCGDFCLFETEIRLPSPLRSEGWRAWSQASGWMGTTSSPIPRPPGPC